MNRFTLKAFASDTDGSFDPSGVGKSFGAYSEAFEYAKEYARCVAGRDGEWWTEPNGDETIVIARKHDGYNEAIRVVTAWEAPTYEARDGFVTRTFDTQSGSSVTR